MSQSEADGPAGEAAVWVWLAGAAAVLAFAVLVVAGPLSRVLFPPVDVHFFPIWTRLVHPKPAEETRYLLAVALTIAAATGLARVRPPAPAGRLTGLAAGAAKLGAAGFALWCFARYATAAAAVGVGHFRTRDLVAGAALAALAAAAVRRRPGLVSVRERPEPRLAYIGVAVLVTACWLLPAIFRDRSIGHALFVMWWHLEFVYGDFVATLGGRTPLVDYNAEYGSLLPLLLAPPLRLFGLSVGSFTALMCLLTTGALTAVERALALVSRSERLALVLYLPFLAGGLFTDYRGPGERFYFANYFGAFPLRYLGPYLLFWLCVRHLRRLRPRGAAWLFLLAGLATLNDVEFGLPALAATAVALAAAAPRSEPVRRWLAARRSTAARRSRPAAGPRCRHRRPRRCCRRPAARLRWCPRQLAAACCSVDRAGPPTAGPSRAGDPRGRSRTPQSQPGRASPAAGRPRAPAAASGIPRLAPPQAARHARRGDVPHAATSRPWRRPPRSQGPRRPAGGPA
ncbi:MAG: hypothetical protein ACR2KV_10150 [Solirubrobacteraceae bacterium]